MFIGEFKIPPYIQRSLTERQMIAALRAEIVQVHMPQPPDIALNKRKLSETVRRVVSRIKRQSEYGAFQQQPNTLRNELTHKRTGVLNGYRYSRIPDSFRADIAERGEFSLELFGIHLVQADLSVGKRDVISLGKVHIQHGYRQPLGKFYSIKNRLGVRFCGSVIYLPRVERALKVYCIIDPVLPRYSRKLANVNSLGLIFRKVHTKLSKSKSKLSAHFRTFLKIVSEKCRKSKIHSYTPLSLTAISVSIQCLCGTPLLLQSNMTSSHRSNRSQRSHRQS